jgi:hypothetical protein
VDLITQKGRERTTTVDFVCSLSKKVRAGVYYTMTDLRPMVENLVDNFESDPELCKSLKIIPEPGTKVLCRVDIRPAKGSPVILLKAFISWNHTKQLWYVLIEGTDEMVFENNEPNY